MEINNDINHNTKWWGKVEHRKPWKRMCGERVCPACLENRMHSLIKKATWRMEEYEEYEKQNRRLRISVRKFAGWPNKKKPFKFWD